MASLYTCCTALYISGTFARIRATSCVHQPERSRGTLYTRSTIPKIHTPVNLAIGSTLALMASMYTCCMALYTSNTFARTGATSYEHKPERSCATFYTRYTIPKTHMPVQQAMGSTRTLPESSYTCCKALCISGNWVQRGANSCVP